MTDNSIHYKEYSAQVQYSHTDGCYFGKVLGIQDSITFEAANARDIQKKFERALDDYLSYCREIGKNPDRP